MVGLVAPARRLGFLLGDTTATSINATGWLLFDAGVRWVSGTPSSPDSFIVREQAGGVYLSWRPTDGAQSYRIERKASLSGPWTVIADGVSSPEFVDTGLNNGTYYYRITAQSMYGQSAPSAPVQMNLVQSGILSIGIMGSPHIRTPRPGAQLDFWNSASYTAVVRSALNYQPVAGVTGSWSLAYTPPPGVTFTQHSGTEVTVYATSPDSNLESKKFIYLRYSASAPGYITKEIIHTIELTNRINMYCLLRFPSGIGQTARPFGGGTPNRFFDPDPQVRAAHRNNLAVSLYNEISPLTRQAGINFYITADPAILNVPSNLFQPDGRTVTRRGLLWSDEANYYMDEVNVKGSNPKPINIYCLKELWNGTSSPLGSTFREEDQFSTMIFLGDAANGSTLGPVLAHELLHAVGIEHTDTWKSVTGTFNNMKLVTGKPLLPLEVPGSDYPLRWNLMWPYVDEMTQPIITDDQVLWARRHGRLWSPAFVSRD